MLGMLERLVTSRGDRKHPPHRAIPRVPDLQFPARQGASNPLLWRGSCTGVDYMVLALLNGQPPFKRGEAAVM
jgi:hypothetical protein